MARTTATASAPAPDPFVAAAGAVPGRGPEARWRQVALLSAARAMGDDPGAATALAAVLVALDRPDAAAGALMHADPGDPWAVWWGVIAAGQAGDLERSARLRDDSGLGAAAGPDAREVRRRLAALALEAGALAGADGAGDARFAVLGHRARPDRRMLVAGRSSAVYLVDPGWDAVRVVRLGPAPGTAAGNRASMTLAELIAAVRRGDAGAGWDVPGDVPEPLEPAGLLAALREDVDVRDRRLMELAREVADERARLRDERTRLQEDREAFDLERAAERMRRQRARPAPAGADVPAPRTAADALRLLGLPAGAPRDDIDRAWREQVVRCHPDRTGDLHPALRAHAEGLTVALNTARDLLLSGGRARR